MTEDRKSWHDLKCDPAPFQAMFWGMKTADLRNLSDRDIAVGDTVAFHEHDRSGVIQKYTGRILLTVITHIQTQYILPENCAMLSFRIIEKHLTRKTYEDSYRHVAETGLWAQMHKTV